MASGTLHSTGIARHTIWAARLVVLAAFLDLFVQIPTIAPYANELGASQAFGSFVFAAYFPTNLFGNLAAGFVLDKWGRRVPIIIGLAIAIAAVFSYSVVQTPEQMIVVRAIHGIGAAVLAPGAFAMIGDRAPSDRRGRAMGLTGAIIAVAALVGFPVAGILREFWGADAVFYVDSAFLLATLVMFLVIARDHDQPVDPEDLEPSAAQQERASSKVAMWSAYGAVFAMTVGVGALSAYLSSALENQGESAARSSNTFGVYAFVAILVMASPLSRASDRFGRFGPLIIGLVGVAAGLAIIGVFTEYTGVVVGMAVFGFGYGIVFPAAAAVVIGTARSDRRGVALGVFYAVYSLGVAVGAAGSGILADLDDGLVGLPFLVAAAVVICAVPFVELMRRSSSDPRRV